MVQKSELQNRNTNFGINAIIANFVCFVKMSNGCKDRYLTRRILWTKHVQSSDDFHSRCIHWYNDHRLLPVSISAPIGLAHENTNLASRIHCTWKREQRCVWDGSLMSPDISRKKAKQNITCKAKIYKLSKFLGFFQISLPQSWDRLVEQGRLDPRFLRRGTLASVELGANILSSP